MESHWFDTPFALLEPLRRGGQTINMERTSPDVLQPPPPPPPAAFLDPLKPIPLIPTEEPSEDPTEQPADSTKLPNEELPAEPTKSHRFYFISLVHTVVIVYNTPYMY